MSHILVVEDEPIILESLVHLLDRQGYRVTGVSSVSEAEEHSINRYDLIISDLRLPGEPGTSLITRAAPVPVLIMTSYSTVQSAVDAMKLGAIDYISKPFNHDEMIMTVKRILDNAITEKQNIILQQEVARDYPVKSMIGHCEPMLQVIDRTRQVAPTDKTVLILGETGTGKELVARVIHAHSKRKEHTLISVNCAAFSNNQIESELFGHERGAFTGADRQRIGRFEEANGGTLFLDEVGDTSSATQAKLLRVLQEQRFHRLGGSKLLRTDARIVSATNHDLGARIAEGEFREDLYFRLNVIRIHLPPLRERPEDLVDLAHHFLHELSAEMSHSIRGFTEAALVKIRSHDWPGNVRELHNTLERAVLMAEGPRIDAEDLSILGGRSAGGGRSWRRELPAEGISLRDVERELVIEALERTGYVQKDAAKLIGVSRRKLNYMIQKMGITHPAWRRNRDLESAGG
ncbi:MAG: sigma-54-dependent Fis family transcriptional regulator [Proteobacteria bacterium]|nr:sigma-54-dependent Fis family transcriptional regulator [Pseudomonadota bacterium]